MSTHWISGAQSYFMSPVCGEIWLERKCYITFSERSPPRVLSRSLLTLSMTPAGPHTSFESLVCSSWTQYFIRGCQSEWSLIISRRIYQCDCMSHTLNSQFHNQNIPLRDFSLLHSSQKFPLYTWRLTKEDSSRALMITLCVIIKNTVQGQSGRPVPHSNKSKKPPKKSFKKIF